jgi:non-specific protein-tyrosine kinase
VELRHYIDVLKRHRWLLVEGMILVGLVAGFVSSLQTPVYSSSARVLLRPNDASESLYPGAVAMGSLLSDPDRYVSAQQNIIQSPDVAKAAAKTLGNADPDVLLAHVSVGQAGATDVLSISGTDIDPTRSRDIANAFANAYIENRRLFAVRSLQKASDEIQTKLNELQTRIATLDAQIGDGGLQPGATAGLQTPAGSGVQNATAPNIPQATGHDLSVDESGAPTTREGLKAARYAAAVQYESLYARQQELQVDMSLKKGEAELVSEAKTPTAPVSPKPVRNGILGALVGLLLAIGVSFLHEQLDDRIRGREDAEKATGLTVLAELPADDDSAKHPDALVAASRPRSQLAEAVRSLRTSVEFLGLDEPVRRIVVTSPGPGDGKSTVAANLAAAYAQAGHKTVLVSADLRRPRLEAIFGVAPGTHGLTEVVAATTTHAATSFKGNGNGKSDDGKAALITRQRRSAVTKAVRATNVENLWVLPAGTTPPNPAELLGSKRTEQVLDDLSRLADIVIIDTPPVLAVTDAVVLAGKADGVLLVASVSDTHRKAAERATDTLESDHVRLLGVVLNKCDGKGGYYGYGYAAYYGDNPLADTGKQTRKQRKAAKAAQKVSA